MFDITKEKKKNDPNRLSIKQITDWIDRIIQPDVENKACSKKFQIMVTEIQCNEPECVPIETLVAIMENAPNDSNCKRWIDKILKPVNEVTLQDIFQFDILHDVINDIESRKILAPTSIAQDTNSSDDIKTIESIQSHIQNLKVNRLKEKDAINENLKKMNELCEEIIETMTIPKSNSTFSNVSVTAIPMMKKNSHGTTSSTGVAIMPTPLPSRSDSETASYNSSQSASISNPPVSSFPKAPPPTASLELKSTSIAPPVRHKKGTRPRGCPCCDPDNIDNIVDNLFFMNAPA